MSSIYPVLLSGGSGTRLWPLSRKSYPKQFAKLVGNVSLFQAAAQRFYSEGFSAPLVVTGHDFRFIVSEQLSEITIEPTAIIIEPSARNTAPAILAAALAVHDINPDGLMLVAPSDHVVSDAAKFRSAVFSAEESARNGFIVTFGIQPSRAETGYGWLKVSQSADIFSGVPQPLEAFVEKPNAELAYEMLNRTDYLWNSGIFLFSAKTLIDAFSNFSPELLVSVSDAHKLAVRDLGFTRLDPAAWGHISEISIDYAIMEKAKNLCVMPYLGDWTDLGGWNAVWQEGDPDKNGNVLSENSTAISCEGSLLRSESPRVEIIGIGLKDIVAVATNDAVLIAHMSEAQKVKEAVATLKAKGVVQAESFPHDHRPWGWFESLVIGNRFQVKRIHVKPGASLSLQSHHHRSEHWIVVEGTARVNIDGNVRLVSENQSVYVPLGSIHRMENPGKVPMVLIEVQTGSYLGEDDIIRYDDVYSRGQGAKG